MPKLYFFNQVNRKIIIRSLRHIVNLFLFVQESSCSFFTSVDSCFSPILCKNIRIVHQYYTDVILPPFIGNEKHTRRLLLHIVSCHSSLLLIQLIQIFIVAWQGKFRQKIDLIFTKVFPSAHSSICHPPTSLFI